MGGSCSAPCTAVDYEMGDFEETAAEIVCHDCGGNHLARHCKKRGIPERWQTTPTTVDANWGGASGNWRCQYCTAGWTRTRNHIPPAP